jgi:endoglucanase
VDTRRSRRTLGALTTAVVSLAVGAGLLVAPATATAAVGAPGLLRSARLHVDPQSQARQEMARHRDDPAALRALAKIAGQPQSVWFGDWVPTDRVRAQVARTTTAAAQRRAVASIVLYAVPGRDCGSFSAGGLSGPRPYAAWVRQVAAGIGTRRTIVVLEPDGLAQLDCLSPALRAQRLAMLRDAVAALRRAPGAVVYLDAGHARWHDVGTMAGRLRSAGVVGARGFALNVSNFGRTADEVRYGDRLAAAVGSGARYVVDTSRNGRGPASGDLSWCNPTGRGLGDRPTTRPGPARADAYLWIKTVGQSDGECGRGEPRAGTWWPSYAISLAARASW